MENTDTSTWREINFYLALDSDKNYIGLHQARDMLKELKLNDDILNNRIKTNRPISLYVKFSNNFIVKTPFFITFGYKVIFGYPLLNRLNAHIDCEENVVRLEQNQKICIASFIPICCKDIIEVSIIEPTSEYQEEMI